MALVRSATTHSELQKSSDSTKTQGNIAALVNGTASRAGAAQLSPQPMDSVSEEAVDAIRVRRR